ncbi:MAG: hypothetical protein ACI9AT_001720, partial [Ulvibacter sp.]
MLDLPFGGWIVGFLDYSILGLLDLPSGGWIVRLLDCWIVGFLLIIFTFHSSLPYSLQSLIISMQPPRQ